MRLENCTVGSLDLAGASLKDFDLRGTAQISNIVLKFARTLANSPITPSWNADAEFKSAREKSLKPVS